MRDIEIISFSLMLGSTPFHKFIIDNMSVYDTFLSAIWSKLDKYFT